MKPVIIIRPQPGCDASLAGARSMGLQAHGHPLFAVRPVSWEAPDPAEIDAILFGSANALRHGGQALGLFRAKPAYAVGEATAQAARSAGFEIVETGKQGLQKLLERLRPEHRRLLRPAGKQRVELEPPEGVTIVERTVYESEALAMPEALVALLTRPAVVMLHSATAASHFAACCHDAGIERSNIALAAISERAAMAAGDGWLAVGIAQSPEETDLLALARQMCDDHGGDLGGTAGAMQDESTIEASAPTGRRASTMRTLLLVALFAFACGGALVGWLGWNGYLDTVMPDRNNTVP
ncbi:MAG: uroporphyrinogen-III synthase, partial [Novosphingobium sp.]|nr:uroporphyrinogen-III synthase [Novosphingobium sp.]